MAPIQHQRIPAGIDELVDPARLEPAGDVDMAVGGDHRLHRALIVEAGAAFDPGEAPVLRRHRHPLVIGVAPPRQLRLARVERHGRMAAHRNAAAQRKRRDAGPVGDVLDPNETGQRPSRSRATGRSSNIRPFPGRRSPCQASQTNRIAAAHQKAVSGVRQACADRSRPGRR